MIWIQHKAQSLVNESKKLILTCDTYLARSSRCNYNFDIQSFEDLVWSALIEKYFYGTVRDWRFEAVGAGCKALVDFRYAEESQMM